MGDDGRKLGVVEWLVLEFFREKGSAGVVSFWEAKRREGERGGRICSSTVYSIVCIRVLI